MKRLALLLPALLLAAPAASARPPYRKALADLLALPAASPLNDCKTCHLPARPGADEGDRPHNAFGVRLAALRPQLRKAGQSADITARLLAVADEDSDRDGVANLHELLAGTFPGDAADKPDAAAVARARRKQVELLASLRGYRWRPFDRVERPPLPGLPAVADRRNPIDVFLAAEQQQRGLRPRPEAPRATLLRRLTIDLTGLPPTPEEVDAFLADTRPDAYERLVDRLLASPRYGERWGRHWMDVWRYSDWAGFGQQVRDSQPHIWHWRDWIVESLNAGVPYDRMVQHMLAADELAPTDAGALRATGFLVRNYKLLSREKWMQDAVDHTAMAFLGVTLGCARCHDHMYDPITQKEYYQVRAVFTPHQVRTDRLPGRPDVKVNGLPRVYDAAATPTFLFVRGDDRTPDRTPLEPGVPEALGGKLDVRPVALPRDGYDPDRRAFVTREVRAAAAAAVDRARAGAEAARRAALTGALADTDPLRVLGRLPALARLGELELELAEARRVALEAVIRVEGLDAKSPAWPDAARAAARAQRRAALLEARRALAVAAQAEQAAPLAKQQAAAKQSAAARQALAKAEAASKAPETTAYTPRPLRTYPTTSTGRRLAFARWLTHRDNPLAARVAVNHVWMRHLGQPLAPGVFDFGRNAPPPTHPALLDWLAAEFMESGWDLKHLHRLILTSAAYRRASTPEAGNLARDPDNVYLWRFAPRRVEAEVVRDSVLFVAGRLDGTLGGPDIDHRQGLVVLRRSLYFQHAAERQMELLQIFDGASVTECYQRKQAVMPQQALALVNNAMVLRHARLTARALHTAGDDARFTQAAYARVLSRPPTAEETAACVGFLAEQAARLPAGKAGPDRDGAAPAADPRLRARENLVLVLINHHEFVTLR